jgi:hypothetical protein
MAPEITGPATSRPRRPGRLALFIGSLIVSLSAFLLLDWTYTTWARNATPTAVVPSGNDHNCFARDPIRRFAFEPNCTCTRTWLKDSFNFTTNSLGFRDVTTRQVPATDIRPRVLMLGDSELEGMLAWEDSFVGTIENIFPQYDFLNAGVEGYSPSTYLTTARMVLQKGVHFDEAIVFVDISDVQDEAAYFHDADSSGAVAIPRAKYTDSSWYSDLRLGINQHFGLTDSVFDFFEHLLVKLGVYHLNVGHGGNEFDLVRSAWTYRPVSDTLPYETGYAPLGVDGGIAKEKQKMDLLWQELKERNIPISIVVYPWPAQLVHDNADSRQVRIWRDWCRDRCKRFITVFPAFYDAKAKCDPLHPGCWYDNYFIFGDTHYNARGHGLVAAALTKALQDVPPEKVPDLVSRNAETGDHSTAR